MYGQFLICETIAVGVACSKIVPSLHKRYIESMVGMFGDSAAHCIENMRPAAIGGLTVDMENYYSRLALDIIGKVCVLYLLRACMLICQSDL
jgi:hypothetical protein